MKRRFICTGLILVMLCSLLTGCDSNGAAQKPEVTLTVKLSVHQLKSIVDGETEDCYTFLKKAAEAFAGQYTDADVTVNIVQYESGKSEEEIVGCFDTEEAADILFDAYFNMSTYVYTGRVVPLDDIITEDIKSDIGEEYWENSRIDGKTYMMPFISSQNVLAYNKALFRQAGLEEYISNEDEVQSWTLEEWEDILAGLKENLPSTVYPMMMYAADSQGDTHIMTLLRSRGSSFFDENGRVALDTKEGREALEWIRDCNEKGYFPSNPESLVMLDNYDLFMNGQLAIYCGSVALSTFYDEAGMDYGLVNFPSVDGNGYNSEFLTGFEVFDNGDEERLKVAKDFIRYIYETDWLDYSAGGIPVSNRVADKYEAELEDIKKYILNQSESINITSNNPNWRGVRAVFYPYIQELLYGEMPIEEIARGIDADCNAAIETGYENSKLHE